MTVTTKDVKKIVRELRPEWWKRDGKETFIRLGTELAEAGFSRERIENFLGDAIFAMRNEYGD